MSRLARGSKCSQASDQANGRARGARFLVVPLVDHQAAVDPRPYPVVGRGRERVLSGLRRFEVSPPLGREVVLPDRVPRSVPIPVEVDLGVDALEPHLPVLARLPPGAGAVDRIAIHLEHVLHELQGFLLLR